jgi:predicted site-specific integrase-resolvase
LVGDGTWLTVHEVATRLDVSDGTARAWSDAGKVEVGDVEYPLTMRRLPGRLAHRRVRASDVERIRGVMFPDPS